VHHELLYLNDVSQIPGESASARKRRLAGSRRGAARTQARYAALLTRKTFGERVGLSRLTLKKWETAGALKPQLIEVGGVPTWVFDKRDIERAIEIRTLMRTHLGTMSIAQAAAELDGRTRDASTRGRRKV
jgi:DNA-binding XRE family transcriptional regulator